MIRNAEEKPVFMEDETTYVPLHTDALPWKPYPELYQTGGIEWKLLHTHASGQWTAAYRGPAGAYLHPHVHSGPAHAFVLSGQFQVRAPDILEAPGYAYEMAGAAHPKSTMLVDRTEFVITMDGPLQWVTKSGMRVEQNAASAARLWAEQCGNG